MSEATDQRNQRHETTQAPQTASLLRNGDPSAAIRMRIAAVAGERPLKQQTGREKAF